MYKYILKPLLNSVKAFVLLSPGKVNRQRVMADLICVVGWEYRLAIIVSFATSNSMYKYILMSHCKVVKTFYGCSA